MMNQKRMTLIMGILLIIGLIGSSVTINRGGITTSVIDRMAINKLDTAEVNALNTIVEGIGKVQVRPTEGEEILVTLEGKGGRQIGKRYTLITDIEESMLTVHLEYNQVGFFNFSFLSNMLQLTVYLPEKQYESLTINNDVGEVRVNQIQARELKVDVSAGSIEIDQMISEITKLNTNVGTITVDHLVGSLEAQVNVGTVKLTSDTINQNIDIQVDVGSIEVEFENEPENVLFSTAIDLGSTKLFGDTMSSKLIGSGENLVNLSANIGDITVRQK